MRFKLTVAPIAAVALAAGGVTLASAASNGSSDHDHGRVVKVFEHTDQTQDVDLGPSGFGLGDEFVFSSELRRREGGPVVGTDGGVCTFVRTEQNGTLVTAHCVATAKLEGGQITVQGLATFTDAPTAPPFDLAVTGGTGAYEGAGGHLHVEEVDETHSILTFHLQGGRGHGHGHDD